MLRRAPVVLILFAMTACGTATSAPATSSPSAAVTPPTTPSSPSPTSTGEPPRNIEVGIPEPGAVISAFGSIWVQDRQDGSVWRLDRHGSVLAKIPHAVRAIEHRAPDTFTLGAGFNSVWGLTDGAVVRIDPATNKRIARIPVPDHMYAIAVGREGVWASCCAGGLPFLMRIDPSTNTATKVADMPVSPSSFAVGEGYVWWGDLSEAGAMQRVAPESHDDVRIEAANMRFIVPTPRWTWLIAADGSTQRVRSAAVTPARDSGRKAPIAIGATYAGGIVWINAGDAIGFDADTGTVRDHVRIGRSRYDATAGIAVLDGHVWVADPLHDRVTRAPIA